MPGRAERAVQGHQRFVARLGTVPDILLGIAGLIASVIVLFGAFGFFGTPLFWVLLLFSLLGFSVVSHTGFSILPEWASRVPDDSGGRARWPTSKEIQVLYGSRDNTAP